MEPQADGEELANASKGKTTERDDRPPRDDFSRALIPWIPIIFAGLGGLAFVAAVGGLVTEARLRGAGLPSAVSVSVLPQGQLLALGATLLGGVFVAALAFVAVVHWWDAPAVREMLQREERQNANGHPPGSPWAQRRSAGIARAHARVVDLLSVRRRRLRLLFTLVALGAWASYFGVWHGAWPDGLGQWELAILFGLGTVLTSTVVTILAADAVHFRRVNDPGREGRRLAALFGAFSFLAALVATLAGFTSPDVRPLVVSLKHPSEVLCGLFVGETSDRVYIGEVARDSDGRGIHAGGAVIVVDRTRVDRLIIGSYQSLGGALKRSLKLAKDLPTGHRTCGLDPAQHQVNMIGQ